MGKLTHQFQGTWSAIATPFSADAMKVDYESLENLIDFQHKAKVQGIVACGSTGEASALTADEYREVVQAAVRFSKGKFPCVAGIGSNCTDRAVEIAEWLSGSGVDGILLVAPPYNKPPQAGIIEHFRRVKNATKLPIIAYNVPGRTAVNILPSTVAEMAAQKLIVSLKDASGSIDQLMDTIALTGDSISILSGEDSLIYAGMCCGGHGTISASANVIPDLMEGITSNALAGNLVLARDFQYRALPMVRAMFMETNPIPVKAALALRGVIKSAALRLPLMPAQDATVQRIKSLLEK